MTDVPPHLAAPASDVSPPELAVRFAARSEAGPRAGNEDRFLVAELARSYRTRATNLDPGAFEAWREQPGWLFAVADGMGGAAAGEVASTLALSLGLRLGLNRSRWFFEMGDDEAQEVASRAAKIFQRLDAEIAERSRANPELHGMGSTLTVAYAVGDRLFLYHVGDSRAYLVRGGKLLRLTQDQTLAQWLADHGQIPPEEIANHHLRHVLYQAIGRSDGKVEVEIHRLALVDGDRLVLASDGLSDALSDAELEPLAIAADAPAACDRLLEAALVAGGRDNVTVLVADFSFAPPRPESDAG
ncbi:MAG: protein phosphatase 2C domain-containing protein [Thermoanaerobaculia bacterium]